MNNKIDSFTSQFIELIDKKYKDFILKRPNNWTIFNPEETYKYKSLKNALDHNDTDFIIDVLLDLEHEYSYDFEQCGLQNNTETKEGRIFENLADQIVEYTDDNPDIFITKDEYEWIKNAPSREECIERDKLSRNIINNIYMG